MKILLINNLFYPTGGAERYFFNLGQLLEKNGHQVIYFSMKSEQNISSAYEKYFIDNIDLQNLKKGLLKKACHVLFSTQAYKNLDKLIKNEKPDIAHIQNIYLNLSPSILYAFKKNKIPVVQTLHDYKLICPNARLFNKGVVCEKCKKFKYYNCAINKCVNGRIFASVGAMFEQAWFRFFLKFFSKPDLYIAPSEFLQTKLKEWGIKDRVELLPNFVNEEDFNPNIKSKDYILFVGRLEEYKGLRNLIKAIEGTDIKLKLAGQGPLYDEIKNKNLNNVELLGHVSKEKIKQLLADCQFLVLPTLMYENNPIAVIEAMATAKPIIGSNIGGIPELVKNNQNGFIFESENSDELKEKILKLYNNHELINKFSNASFDLAKTRFTPEYHYEKLINFYHKVITL